jgi:geranylgeranyl diphosphate synthase, type I
MANLNFNQILAQYAEPLDAEIRAELNIELEEFMRGAISYHFGWCDQNFQSIPGGNSGKKLRPIMFLLAYQGANPHSFEADLTPAMPVAACLEMIHNYSLLHDDIEDDDLQRRGRATAWAIWGKPIAINIGDCLHVLAFRRLFRAAEKGLSHQRVLQIASTIAAMSVKLALGQHKDLSFEGSLDVTPGMYIDMIGGKTAAIFACALECGAIAGLPDPLDHAKIKAFADFGLKIGLGFQIRDDILGIWGIESETGKPSGSDIRRRKKSLPVLYALNNTSGTQHEQILDIYRRTEPLTPEEEQFVFATLESCGAKDYTQQQADYYKQEALAALSRVGSNNPALEQLKQLCTFLVERSY